MRKFNVLLLAFVLVLAAGCTKKEDNNEKPEATVSFDEITTSIKEAIAKDLKEDGGVEEEVLVDGKLTYYLETDLTASESDDPAVSIWLEKMNLDQAKISNGTVIAAMMMVNSDEVILLEAKDEADVATLKASLEKELENQVQTWKQYLPDQYEKVKQNTITTKGKYLLYVTYTNRDKVEDAFNAQFN